MEYAFDFYESWVRFGDKIESYEERINYYRAISRYGAFRKESDNLQGEVLDYFQTQIRPELDRQHEAMKKGGRK